MAGVNYGDSIVRFKPITPDDMYKGIDKNYSTIKTANDLGGGNEPLRWYYVERENEGNPWSTDTEDMRNLFHSFGISREDQDDWFKIFGVVDWYNAKRMVIAQIPQSGCGSYIDGSTLQVKVPIGSGTGEYVTFYGSTFTSYPDPITENQLSLEYSDNVYGGAYCYLFANTTGAQALPVETFPSGWYHPYTGNVNGGENANAGASSFDQDSTDAINQHLSATHWQQGDDGHDVPYGVAFLEKGIFIIFDMYGRHDFIGNTSLSATTVWTSPGALAWIPSTFTGGTGVENSSLTNRKAISFGGTNGPGNAKVTYRTITQSYKNVYFCHAGQSEFNSTSNHTYNHKKAYFRPDEAESLWITEIGLYDNNDSLLAYAKLSEPVEKNKLETMTFKVELEL